MVSRRRYLAVLGAGVLAGCNERSDGTTGRGSSVASSGEEVASTGALETERPTSERTEATTSESSTGSPPTGAAVRWSVPVGAPVTASPVVADGRIFLGSGSHPPRDPPFVAGELTPANAGSVHAVDVEHGSRSEYVAPAAVLSVGATRERGGLGGGRGGGYAILGWYGGLGGVNQRLVRVADGRPQWTGPGVDENRFVATTLPDGVVTGTRDERIDEFGHRLRCRDRSGAFRWEVASGDVLAGATDDGRVYVTEGSGNTRCLRAASGETLWTYPGWAPTWRPRVDGDVVLAKRAERTGLGGSPLVALDAASGEPRWSFAGDGERAFTPVEAVRTTPDGTADAVVFVAGSTGRLFAVDESGRGLYRYDVEAPIVAGPRVAGGHAYVVDLGGGLHAVDATTGERAWTREGSLAAVALGANADGVVVVAAGTGTDGTNRHRVRGFAHDGTARFDRRSDGGLLNAFAHDGVGYAVTRDGHLARFGEPST